MYILLGASKSLKSLRFCLGTLLWEEAGIQISAVIINRVNVTGKYLGSVRYIGLGHEDPKKCRMTLNGGISRLLLETARCQVDWQLLGRDEGQGGR